MLFVVAVKLSICGIHGEPLRVSALAWVRDNKIWTIRALGFCNSS